MGFLAVAFSLGYALANTLSAWALLRRRPGVAALYFVAAVASTVGGVATAYAAPESAAVVAVAAVAATAASLRVAWVGLTRPPAWWWLIRVGAGALAVLLADLATRL